MGTQIFNEDSLLRDVQRVWGEHGAHAEVLRDLIKMAWTEHGPHSAYPIEVERVADFAAVPDRPLCERFELHNGQIRYPDTYHNALWFLNGTYFGMGDLSHEDIGRITRLLLPGETFDAYNEHHGSDWQQMPGPYFTITVPERR